MQGYRIENDRDLSNTKCAIQLPDYSLCVTSLTVLHFVLFKKKSSKIHLGLWLESKGILLPMYL